MAELPVLLGLLLATAAGTATALTRDPVRQAMVLAVFGVTLAVLFMLVQAPDVALSQLAVGTVLTPLMVLLSVRKVRRRAQRSDERRGTERRGTDERGTDGRGTEGRGTGRREEGAE